MSYRPDELLTRLLRDVSRSFYLTLRVLPPPVRPQIGLAYLLARATDTIADTDIVSVAHRAATLDTLRRRILGEHDRPIALEDITTAQGAPAERVLLERLEDALARLAACPPDDRALIRQVLAVITSGQQLDLQRFAAADAGNVIALQQEEELTDYTYRVAGCVGEFWTRICRAHLFPQADLNDEWLLERSVRFGQGLQLVNILRDLPRDLRAGRCYLPADRLHRLGLAPTDLLRPETETRLRPLYNEYLDLAGSHLRAAWMYTQVLPWRCVRVRLACAWPVLIAVRTLEKLREMPVLNPELRIKVGRPEIYRLILQSTLLYPTPWWPKLVR